VIHGIFCTHITFDKEGIGRADVCIRRLRRRVNGVAFIPDLPDHVIYFITSETLIDIMHDATTAAQAVRIIWRSLPADGLELPT